MVIYGVAILAFCTIVGIISGKLIGLSLGIDANVGGVGIAMVLLLFITSRSRDNFRLNFESEKGIAFWTAMYIPIVVAMAAKQNVIGALDGGWIALSAGLLAVVLSFALIRPLANLAKQA